MNPQAEMEHWAAHDPKGIIPSTNFANGWGAALVQIANHPEDPFSLAQLCVGDWSNAGTRRMRCWLLGHVNGDEHPSGYLITRGGAGYRCSSCGQGFTVLELGVQRGFGVTPGDVATRLRQIGISIPSTPPSDGIDSVLRNLLTDLTDRGSATFFASCWRNRLLYHAERKTWLVYTGTHWTDDKTNQALRYAMETTNTMVERLTELSNDDQSKLAKHAFKTRNESRLRAMLSLAKSLMPVTSKIFNADPMKLNVLNGTIDLRTGSLHPHRAEDLLTKIVPVEYDRDAKAPTWHGFVSRTFDKDPEYIAFVQRLVGYCLTGAMNEKAFFVIWGPSNTGKTVFAESLKKLLGDYGQTAALSAFAPRHNEGLNSPDIARMEGRRLVLASESGEGKQLNEEMIKRITGSDSITACFKYGDHFEYLPQCKIMLVTNFKPEIREADDSIWGRVRVLPFNSVISEADKDTNLLSKIDAELSGILNWALAGTQLWLQNGLGSCRAVDSVTCEYRTEMDVLGHFIKDSCTINESATAAPGELYTAYATWTKANGYPPCNQNLFSRRLRDIGYRKFEGARGRWKGIAPREVAGADSTLLF